MKIVSSPVPKDSAREANPLIEQNCPCPRECPRHGNCFECVANHRDHMNIPPFCLHTEAPGGGIGNGP